MSIIFAKTSNLGLRKILLKLYKKQLPDTKDYLVLYNLFNPFTNNKI